MLQIAKLNSSKGIEIDSIAKICSTKFFFLVLCVLLLRLSGCTVHCMKSVRIRSFSNPYFPVFGLNTDQKNSVFLCIQSECGKIRSRITPTMDSFYAVIRTEKCNIIKISSRNCLNALSYVKDSVFYVDCFVTIAFCDLSNPSIVKINSGKFAINDPIANSHKY